mmetsp:Transcript_3170/g.12217  ORF Transcript_3170/g.12217 Transcript_3170/m.12217 type:complete len:217 (+) Transcript_3170:356-1006(+)
MSKHARGETKVAARTRLAEASLKRRRIAPLHQRISLSPHVHLLNHMPSRDVEHAPFDPPNERASHRSRVRETFRVRQRRSFQLNLRVLHRPSRRLRAQRFQFSQNLISLEHRRLGVLARDSRSRLGARRERSKLRRLPFAPRNPHLSLALALFVRQRELAFERAHPRARSLDDGVVRRRRFRRRRRRRRGLKLSLQRRDFPLQRRVRAIDVRRARF